MRNRERYFGSIGLVLGALAAASGCTSSSPADENDTAPTTAPTAGPSDTSTGAGTTSSTGGDPGQAEEGTADPTANDETTGTPPVPVIFDVFDQPDLPPTTCGAPTAIPCDGSSDDPLHAMGINCDIGPQADGELSGDPLAFYVHEGDLGTFQPPPFPPREGDKFLIMSSGHAADMIIPGLFASNDIVGFVDNSADLPAPINVNRVSLLDTCTDDPGLVGTGDCSNTIQEQWDQGSGAYDYVEIRLETEVPFETYSFSYDFAMFSTEYPNFYQSGFNDMYIGWLESELWTGNISFDEMGRPISLNAGFLDYKDAPNPFDCPACMAPELGGTAMEGHAGTKWLTTTAGVTPGEDITVIFAVFDLSDPILDTVVILDNFQWGCMGGAPVTIPG
jgi:hypothetical protein